MALVKQGDFTFAFPTLIMRRQIEDHEELNAGLLRVIDEQRQRSSGVTKSNVGAWHSELDFLRATDRPVLGLLAHLNQAIRDYFSMEQQRQVPPGELTVRLVGWAMVYRRGDYAVPHVHPNANFSGVYYVDGGDDDPEVPESGLLTLIDPRAGATALETDGWRHATTLDVKPQAGLLVVFPAWLSHHVHPYRGSRDRVAVSFNVSLHRTAQPEG